MSFPPIGGACRGGDPAHRTGWQAEQLARARANRLCPRPISARLAAACRHLPTRGAQSLVGKPARTLIRFPHRPAQRAPFPLCTRGKGARTLTLNEQAAHVALVERREEQSTPAFLKRHRRRAGIEGTISQALRTTTLRRSPYVGLSKTHLHHLIVAAALNFVRLDQFLQRQQQGLPARPSRLLSPLARLQARSTG